MTDYKQFGGVITEANVLKYVKSIGYEFETHDLAKLSLEGDSYLINSSKNNESMDDEELRFDDNYFQYEIGLQLEDDPSSSFVESEESKQSLTNGQTVYSPEIDTVYVEYMLEPKPNDGNGTKVSITNDIAATSFTKMLDKRCDGRQSEKNSLYIFRTHSGQNYSIKFDHDLLVNNTVGTFSGLEIVITFYKPKTGKNLIVNSFADACERIVNHLSGMKEYRGDLFAANKNKKGFTALGKIPYRKLFHKEGTNLYYMETYDGPYTNTRMSTPNITFKPQMTFCTEIQHVYDVIEHIAGVPKGVRVRREERKHMESIGKNYSDLMNLVVIPMLQEYNAINMRMGWKCDINFNSEFGKIIRNYVFLIYIKLDAYLVMYENQPKDDEADTSYFKNYLFMLVRHSNFELYSRIKYHLKKHFKKSDEETAQLASLLLCNLKFLRKIYYDKPEIFGKKPAKTHEDYGNPKKNLESYFAYFENPSNPEVKDWLILSKIDGVTTMYPLKEDDIIIENRFFSSAARLFYAQDMKKRISGENDGFSLKQMIEIIAHNKNKSAQDLLGNLSNKVLNPNTGRMVAKCEDGKVHNEKFRCVKYRPTVRMNSRATTTRRAK